MACSKLFSLSVVEASGCAALFADIPWGAPTIDAGCSGSFVGASFSASSVQPGPNPDCQAAVASCTAPVGLTNTGDELSCCLQLTVTANDGALNISIFDFVSLTNLISITQVDVVLGLNSFPFTVPAGAIMQIGVQAASFEGDLCGPDGQGPEAFSGTFGACP